MLSSGMSSTSSSRRNGGSALQVAAFARRGLDIAQAAADQRHAAAGVARRERDRSRCARRCWRSRSPRRGRAGRGSARTGSGRTSASLPEWPSTMAFVESQIIASTPRSPSSAKAASSVGGPTSGAGSSFQSPVCSTSRAACRSPAPALPGSNAPCAGTAAQTAAGRWSPPGGTTCSFTSLQHLRLGQLAAQHRGGERRGIDRAAQLRPQPGARRRDGPHARG